MENFYQKWLAVSEALLEPEVVVGWVIVTILVARYVMPWLAARNVRKKYGKR